MTSGDDRFSDLPPNPFAAPLAVEEEGTQVPTQVGEMTLNPWLSIWTKPRATIRQLLDTNGSQLAPMIVAIAGVSSGFGNTPQARANAGADATTILLVGAVVGGLVGAFLMWALCSWLVRLTGSWLGGKASFSDILTAYAWSMVPAVWATPFSIFIALAGGANPNQALANNPTLAIAFMVVGGLMIVIGFWQMVITCKAIGEAHLFSAWHAVGAILLGGLVMVGIALAVAIPIALIIAATA